MNLLDDAHACRHANAAVLSLALLDARNHTLRWLAAFEAQAALTNSAGGVMPLRLVAEAGRWQDDWIARHVQRARGEACDASAPRLPPADATLQAWFDGAAAAPGAAVLRAWLAQTLETTLALLNTSETNDAGLHFFRAALLHEDRLGEALAERAAELQLPAAEPWQAMPLRASRPAANAVLQLPAQRVQLGARPGGFVPTNERWAHEVALPEFEIDAQVVSWARFVEFAEDGGYDRRELWSDAGWAWQQALGRRAPRHVEQLRGSVLVQRHGRMQRVAAGQAVVHASRHEAEAWCCWAGRRLPTEPEWEAAASSALARGFVWGDVFEWVAGSARAWPGHSSAPGDLDSVPAPSSQGVLRGASWLSRARCCHPKARRFAPPSLDTAFSGFRSCAL